MKISCNRLKKYIKDCNDIDFLTIWDKFTIRIAEVEGIEVKGQDVTNVVVAQITSCEPHPKKDKYHILKVNNGQEEVSILCGAPNVRKGLKVALINVGGTIQGITINEKEIAGVLSQGMILAEDELGIGYNHDGIMELPEEWIVGKDIKEYIPIEDIIVEIDNKSLTNRPDLWGHYGIAREIAAITNHELLALPTEEVTNDKEDLDINIINPDLCYRYIGIKIDNITNNVSPWDMKVFLYYVGMRSISLIVDLTNYLMLELGTPMHAFDAKMVRNIEIGLAEKGDKFTTLDGNERTLSDEMLMIKNNNEYYAIAGIMGGLDSEISDNTNSIVLESATFDAMGIRKTATALGLRTEASTRYEKSLDPNMSEIASKRFIYLLRENDSQIIISSNLTDKYPKKLESNRIKLYKDTLSVYMGQDLSEEVVTNILSHLDFKVNVEGDYYDVIVPTFRSTKDISIEEDLIEEIARIYGYENIEKVPLKVDLKATEDYDDFSCEYDVKKLLATKFDLNEVNTYVWYKTSFLSELNINKSNTKLLGKTEDNILRDDINLSLVEAMMENAKNYSKAGIFEIGTEYKENDNYRVLSACLMDDTNNIKNSYYTAKKIVTNIFETFKNIMPTFDKSESEEYYINNLSTAIFVDNEYIGSINVLEKTAIKKKSLILIKIDFDKFKKIETKLLTYNSISKYPSISLDYTIVADKSMNYSDVEKIINEFTNEHIISVKLIDVYENDLEKRYTIRYVLVSNERTLTSNDIEIFKNEFICHIKANNLLIVE